jgi:hypothetical protein
MKTWTLHKSFVCHNSPYFEAAFNSALVEGQTQTLVYDKTTPEAFGLFAKWIYSKTIKDDDGKSPPPTEMVQLWVLADKILVPGLQNAAIRGLHERGCIISLHEFGYVYDNTTVRSPLRRLLVDQLLVRTLDYKRLDEYIAEYLDLFPKQMLAQMLSVPKRNFSPTWAQKRMQSRLRTIWWRKGKASRVNMWRKVNIEKVDTRRGENDLELHDCIGQGWTCVVSDRSLEFNHL